MSRTGDIVDRITSQIERGLLKPGDRLHSVRAGAQEHGVSKNTMSEVYDRLVAMGRVEAKQGSGYYVARAAKPRVEPRPPHLAEAVDHVSLLREQLERHYSVRVGDGRPPPSWLERLEVGAHARLVRPVGSSDLDHGYGNPWGYAPLRERIALMLADRSITAPPERILLTQGANHALDLVCRQLLEPGDTALVDTPGYYPLFGKLKLARVTVAGVRRRADGPDLEDFAAKIAALKPKVFFTQSLAHNPTGGSISIAVAHRLLQIAAQHGVLIVEDDPFADVLPASAPRLAALDQLERVIYIGTFSKTLSASLRVGYIAAAPALAQSLCDLKMLTVVSTSDYVERLIFTLIAGGQYLRHLRRLRARIETAGAQSLAALERVGIAVPAAPAGGYYIWGTLPAGLDEAELVRAAADRGIFLAPGSVFSTGKIADAVSLRINIAYASDPRFLDFIAEQVAGIGR
ncbi:PLP-dependent aminotransferase family protein [Azospirillum doebereinerae]|uniref:aminotransferase-like domain-containing protein n=1 Tax=Azospirillum doebereinerae TaxID=92933 RepID=UPI001EE5423F|nr:PLP-dependent aminotransferase family protein [Azospirillum doebereinerae]MCG5242389.1 PLP-dependent aminotransferase family protein [Azospirillum doebereinerae]